ncbi:unnamed protein product [Caenorhabditis auriculariae]|uniref:Uncharacterized protein n=1 Tax=Caenorhabditis auriculariae TaxID=2777116 RepID=A0A8S1HF43_9PELO|nr:unnamed protein product [Caenorhabditis auriculariae]
MSTCEKWPLMKYTDIKEGGQVICSNDLQLLFDRGVKSLTVYYGLKIVERVHLTDQGPPYIKFKNADMVVQKSQDREGFRLRFSSLESRFNFTELVSKFTLVGDFTPRKEPQQNLQKLEVEKTWNVSQSLESVRQLEDSRYSFSDASTQSSSCMSFSPAYGSTPTYGGSTPVYNPPISFPSSQDYGQHDFTQSTIYSEPVKKNPYRDLFKASQSFSQPQFTTKTVEQQSNKYGQHDSTQNLFNASQGFSQPQVTRKPVEVPVVKPKERCEAGCQTEEDDISEFSSPETVKSYLLDALKKPNVLELVQLFMEGIKKLSEDDLSVLRSKVHLNIGKGNEEIKIVQNTTIEKKKRGRKPKEVSPEEKEKKLLEKCQKKRRKSPEGNLRSKESLKLQKKTVQGHH